MKSPASMTIEQEILDLVDEDGLIHPQDMVDWARAHDDSLLYRQFEWDDTKAAERYRVWQARQLIAIHVVDVGGDRRTISLTLDRANGGGYRVLDEVLGNDALRRAAVSLALEELERWTRRYDYLGELQPIMRAAERTAQRLRTPPPPAPPPRGSRPARPEPPQPTA